MRCAAVAAWSAVLLVSVATAAYSAAQGDASPPKGDQAQAVKSLEAVFGKTLISIDGSTIQIIASEGRLAREIVAANGAVQRSNFVFINARLGTVADSRDAARVIGVFRASAQEILVQYGDGSTETVLPNAEGGITIETTSAKEPTYCVSWYPEGHVFSLDDRKAALLQYANRLGLGVSTEKAAGTPARSGCDNAAPSATAASSTTSAPAASPVPAVAPAPAALAPPAAAPAPAMPDAADKAASSAGSGPGAGAPVVLPSVADATAAAAGKAVELPAVPKVAEVTAAAKITEAPSAAKTTEAAVAKDAEPAVAAKTAETTKVADAGTAKDAMAAKVESAAEKAAELAGAKVASLPATESVEVRKSDVHLIDPVVAEPTPAVATTGDAAKPGEVGASSCLSVESDGAHWGFRNKCAFSVQYAYCTMDGRNQLTACKDGFVGGSVAANGFGVLVADQNLRALNENHDFRWVACQGGAGEVIARLDKSDPPIGRCVR